MNNSYCLGTDALTRFFVQFAGLLADELQRIDAFFQGQTQQNGHLMLQWVISCLMLDPHSLLFENRLRRFAQKSCMSAQCGLRSFANSSTPCVRSSTVKCAYISLNYFQRASKHSLHGCITSHHITSHHITSHHITSPYLTSPHIASHHTTSHHITSHHITSHHITSHHITSHHMTGTRLLCAALTVK